MSDPRYCLFIGGVADGERRAVDVAHRMVTVASIPDVQLEVLREGRITFAVGESYYERHVVHAEGTQFFVYAPPGMTDAELMATLLNAYRPNERPR